MGAIARRRRFGIGVAQTGGALIVLLVGVAPFGASGSGAPVPAGVPRISLKTPPRAEAGDQVSATGVAVGVASGAQVRLQGRGVGGWRVLAHAIVRKGHFALSFLAPTGEELEVRAGLMLGGREAATSPVRRIAISTGAASVPGSSGRGRSGSEPAPVTAGSPPSAGAPPSSTPPSTTLPVTSPPTTGTPPSEPPVTEPPPTEPPPTEPPPATTNSYWGAWIGSQLTGEEAPWDMNAVTDFEDEVGKAPSLIEFSSPFSDCSSNPCSFFPFPRTPFEEIRRRGAIPFFSWSSQSLPSQVNEPEYQLADIAAGNYDRYIREFAMAAAAWGHPFFLRFDWEMNGTWFPWAAGANGNTAADYVAAWQHVHQIFTQVGATNASWVWCPYVNPNSTLTDMATLYPGDGYVDWTCLDGYNWGPSASPPRKWRSFSYLFGPSYRQITESIAPAKPMVVGETASAEAGGSKKEWIEEAFTALPVEFPRIQGLIWFDKEDEDMHWPLESSPEATAAFKAGIAGSRYLANSFAGIGASPIPAP